MGIPCSVSELRGWDLKRMCCHSFQKLQDHPSTIQAELCEMVKIAIPRRLPQTPLLVQFYGLQILIHGQNYQMSSDLNGTVREDCVFCSIQFGFSNFPSFAIFLTGTHLEVPRLRIHETRSSRFVLSLSAPLVRFSDVHHRGVGSFSLPTPRCPLRLVSGLASELNAPTPKARLIIIAPTLYSLQQNLGNLYDTNTREYRRRSRLLTIYFFNTHTSAPTFKLRPVTFIQCDIDRKRSQTEFAAQVDKNLTTQQYYR